MRTVHGHWTIKKLSESYNNIEFPEFQREPTVWNLEKKQRLIDSILRDFDISSIYFFKKENGGYDCIDGRQRINAIISFLGINDKDEHDNAFHLKIENEIYDDKGNFNDVDAKRFNSFSDAWKNKFLNFKLNIVEIEKVEQDEELNLLFLRLQIASVLNAGEKLHAMTGDLRDWIFLEVRKNRFFEAIKIPQRRYAKEQVAAQIALNYFSKIKNGTFQKSRYVDMQEFFKQYNKLSIEDKKKLKEMEKVYDNIVKYLADNMKYIKNRAIAVSIFLYCNELIDQYGEKEIDKFGDFFVKLLKTMKWQLSKGIGMDKAYQNLLSFQTNITQAAGEKYSIQQRHDFLKDYYYHYKKDGQSIKGDAEYKRTLRKDPEVERKKVRL